MRIVGPSGEAEMIATFLRGEIDAARYAPTLAAILARKALSRRIIDTPDLADPLENEQRRAILGAFRGYGEDRAIFEGFPAELRWTWAVVSRQELAQVCFIDYSYWVELSGGSRLPPDAARAIRAGRVVYGVPNDGFREVAASWEVGVPFPPLIVIGPVEGGPLVLLEGHGRLTGYFLARAAPADLPVLGGWAAGLSRWSCY